MRNEPVDEARLIEPLVFYKPGDETLDPYDFRPSANEYDRMEAEGEIAGPKDSSAQGHAEETSDPVNPETPAPVDGETTPKQETPPVTVTTLEQASSKKISAGKIEQPV